MVMDLIYIYLFHFLNGNGFGKNVIFGIDILFHVDNKKKDR